MYSFLELVSTYRNRQMWPLPGEFEAMIAQSGRNTNRDMLDPVCNSVPISAWTGLCFDTDVLGSDSIECQISVDQSGNANSNTIIEFKSVVPGVLQEMYNYYKHAVMRNTMVTPHQFGRITEYVYKGEGRAQATIDNPNFKFNLGDFINIVDPTDFSSTESAFLFVPDGSDNDFAYEGTRGTRILLYNETQNQSRNITSYDGKTGVLNVNNVTGWQPTDNYSLRYSAPNYCLIAGLSSQISRIVIPPILVDLSNWFIRVPRDRYDNTFIGPQGESRRIVRYDPLTHTIAVSPPFTSSPAGMKIELMQQGYDNANPFTWRGSMKEEIPTYKVTLKKLILPNKRMSVGVGGLPSMADYFYVELSNTENPSQQLYSIYSNNPHCIRAVFRASVKDIVRLSELDYIVLEGDMTQTLRIRIESNIKIRVVIPSTGETFQTVLQDTTSPSAPNPLVQISALFQFEPIY